MAQEKKAFTYAIGQEVFITIGGEISKHTIRWYFEKQGEQYYAITPYGQFSIIWEDKISTSYEAAKEILGKDFEEKKNELITKYEKEYSKDEPELTPCVPEKK